MYQDSAPVAAVTGTGHAPGHIVQFYESDTYLHDTVATFLAERFAAGQPAVVIATDSNCDAFQARLKSKGFDTKRALESGQLTVLSARALLSKFMNGAAPDRDLFRKHVGEVLDACRRQPSQCIRAYGEMVDVLWRDGNVDAAVRLEELWNELAHSYKFHLMCAYSIGNFSTESHAKPFDEVCRLHGRVFPTESYSSVDAADNRLREISQLQQRARALESEIERRRQLEQALRDSLERVQAAHAEAEEASRLKDDFLAVLSHELRTPLNAILGWTQIVNDRRADKATMRRAIDVIGRNAALQMHLIDDLLDVSRIITGKMQIAADPVDLGDVAAAAIDGVRPAATAKAIDVQLQIDASARLVTGDAGRLQQVMWNLLSNAIKFTPKHGSVVLHLERSGSEAELVVKDNGQGIAPEFLPFVFDRFRQGDNGTTRTYGGLGLGLAVVRHLVEAHGGTVSAESAGIGSGATFTVRLPLRAAPATVIVGRALPVAPVTLEGTRCLVVDDNPDARDLLHYVLQQWGATVETALTAREALRVVSEDRFDVLLADIGMPDRDGYELIAQIRGLEHPHARTLRAVAVTAYAGDHHRARAIAAGYDDYLMKPIDPAQLASSIAALVNTRH